VYKLFFSVSYMRNKRNTIKQLTCLLKLRKSKKLRKQKRLTLKLISQ